jgi:hypothetical protein
MSRNALWLQEMHQLLAAKASQNNLEPGEGNLGYTEKASESVEILFIYA